MINWHEIDRELIGRGVDVNRIADALGKPLEPRIKPLVMALNYRGYHTCGSCEGHTLAEKEKRMADKVASGEAKLVFRAPRGLTYERKTQGGIVYHDTFHESPWADFDVISESQVRRFTRALNIHNEIDEVQWSHHLYNRGKEISANLVSPGEVVRMETVPRYSLSVMQASIPRFAENVIRFG
ncbi:hypothetical protein J4233_05190 [Candidatus Pacearchaeota archaeon]|nr:hypothetical protein [Candidatus Pacearchaeota archaeon]